MRRTPTDRIPCLVAAVLLAIVWGPNAIADDLPPLLGTLNQSDYLVSIDRTTGVGTRIGHLGIDFYDAMAALEYDSLHQILYGAVADDLFTVDPATGAASRVSASHKLGFFATGMAHDPITDVLYGAGVSSSLVRKNLYKVNRATGQSELLGPVSGISYSIQGLGFDPGTGTLYGLDEILPSGARIVTIDPATRVATPITGNINTLQTGWNGLAFDPVTNALFVNSDRTLYRVNPVTGNIVTVGMTFAPELETYGALTVMMPFVVPEPNSILLAAALLACLAATIGRVRQPPC